MRKVAVTGGASFIGSHLVEALLQRGDEVIILDNFSSGSFDNLKHLSTGSSYQVCIFQPNLRVTSPIDISAMLQGVDEVYHLAADHGGRGYVETRQVACSNNFAIDNNVFQACILARVRKIIFASSGCAYPLYLQTAETNYDPIKLCEGDIRCEGYDPDGLYGFAKLVGELTLAEIYKEHGIESTSCRFFTVYGPRAKENHAIISFIARAFIKQDPWVVWGDGTQVRNWTHVRDIVQGLLLGSTLSGCQALNIGTEESITVNDAVAQTLQYANHYYDNLYHPEIQYDLTKPTGPMVRVASSEKYKSLGGTLTPFKDGLLETLDWYFETHDREKVAADFERLLIERK